MKTDADSDVLLFWNFNLEGARILKNDIFLHCHMTSWFFK